MSQPMTVAGKVCVVTGGGSGIGAALCRRFAELGAKRESARAVSSSFNGIPVRCNVAKEMDVRRLISIAEAVAGPVDIFVANAGIPSNGGYEVPNDEWEALPRKALGLESLAMLAAKRSETQSAEPWGPNPPAASRSPEGKPLRRVPRFPRRARWSLRTSLDNSRRWLKQTQTRDYLA
eukprot:s2208_g1.t1